MHAAAAAVAVAVAGLSRITRIGVAAEVKSRSPKQSNNLLSLTTLPVCAGKAAMGKFRRAYYYYYYYYY